MKLDATNKRPIFLFDLDGTITTEETLPLIARHFNVSEELARLTEDTIKGNIPFIESFIRRVDILKKIDVRDIENLLRGVKISYELVHFIKERKSDCFVVTGNLSCWVRGLIEERIGCGFFSSEANLENNQITRLSKILKKEEIVRYFKECGRTTVFVGDGNNDSQAMREADISIACGHTHLPAQSVLSTADYAVFDDRALVRLLCQICDPYKPGRTLVLSCAGIGSRLGIGQTKSLIKMHGKTLIEIQLSQLRSIEDIRIVIGFQAFNVIDAALKIRSDMIFVYNHDYFQTGTGMSYYLGSRFAREYAIAWDGDLLVHPDDIQACLDASHEYVGCSDMLSDQPVYAVVDDADQVISFSLNAGDFEWSGPACLKSATIERTEKNVYNQLECNLPLPMLKVRAMDIDTHDDYARALEIVKLWNL